MTRLALALLLAVLPMAAGAHGDASWIMRSPWPQCCGRNDCHQVEAVPTADGWRVRHPTTGAELIIPFDQAKPSENDHFWLCIYAQQWNQPPRPGCFFAPAAGT